jgi:hypothetical protein
MEGVVNIHRHVSQDRNTEVKHVVLEHAVSHEEHHVVDLELRVCEPVAEIRILVLFQVEFGCLRAVDHKDKMGHFNAHLRDKKSIVIWKKLDSRTFVLLDEASPSFLSNQFLLVNSIKENQNSTTSSLNNTQHLNGILHPIRSIWLSIMIFLLGVE